MSPRQPRDIDSSEPLQKILCDTIADAARAARQIEADNRFIAAMSAPVVDHAQVEAALKDGASPDRILPEGRPALHAAVRRGDAALLALLIKYDAELSDTDADGATALDCAYSARFAQGIRLLSEEGAPLRLTGADPRYFLPDEGNGNYQKRVDAVLIRTVYKGTADELRRVLALGADPNAIEHAEGRARYSALHLAISRCDPEKVGALLSAGADVRAVSGRGESAFDMLWWVGSKDLLGAAWFDIYRMLDEKGARPRFSRRPEELTLADLRATVPIGLDGKTSTLHFLVRMGKMDLVMDVVARSGEGLTQADLMKRSGYYGGETLLEAFVASRHLSRLFTAAVWRDRLDEMLALQPRIEADPRARAQVDFDAAVRDIRRYQQGELHRRIEAQSDGIRLKPRPRNAPKKPQEGPDAP